MTDYETWRATEAKAYEAIREFEGMGIRVPTGPGTPQQMSSFEVLSWQTARAFDAAIPDREPIGFGYDDDRIPEPDEDDEPDTDRELRAAAHRVLDQLIDGRRARKRSGRRANDLERQDAQAMRSLLTAHNSIPPWSRYAARAADADGADDLQHFQRLAFESSGCM